MYNFGVCVCGGGECRKNYTGLSGKDEGDENTPVNLLGGRGSAGGVGGEI